MKTDDELLRKRFNELSNRAQTREIYVFSDFLNMYEQSLLQSEIRRNYEFFGGHENCERAIACFKPDGETYYEPEIPVKTIRISPLSDKFSDELTHRDFLGSVLALGIKRETLGDIIICGNRGYLFCLDTVCDYIVENLCKVRHTSVKCEICDEIPEQDEKQPQPKNVNIASERLDVLIAAVYNISRSKSADLCSGEKVFINGKLTTSASSFLKSGDTVSVRGVGRFVFKQVTGETKKGRLRAEVAVY